MAMDVATKDCTALSEGEIQEMVDLASEAGLTHDVDWVGELVGKWVLIGGLLLAIFY